MSACRVVLIEDNPADVFLVQMALKENDVTCELTMFNNGEEALKVLCPSGALGSTPFVPDAILLDLNTPKTDGFSLLNRLRQTPRLAHVPIAILTSSQATSDKARALHLGANRYILKPSQLEVFLSTVGQAVKELLKEQPHSEHPQDLKQNVQRP